MILMKKIAKNNELAERLVQKYSAKTIQNRIKYKIHAWKNV